MPLSDADGFARAYEAHRRAVHATALRILGSAAAAQDVVQDVFLRLWRDPSRFDERRGRLGPYLCLMARSRALDLWRERQAAGRAGERLRLVEDRERSDDGPARRAESAGEATALRAAVRALPAPQLEAVALAYWGGLTAEEVARRVGIPVGTAKSRIRLGLARLRAASAPAAGALVA